MSFDRASDARPPELVPAPTRAGGYRLLTVLDPADEARYGTLVSRMAGVIERGLGPAVLANRVSPGPGLSLEPWRPAWRTLVARRSALRTQGSVILHADIRQCYPSIGGAAVSRALRNLGADRDGVRAVVGLLDRFQEQGVPGLPIGPDPSAVLANAVLLGVDVALGESAYRHVRWVDDVWAAARDRSRAERMLDVLRTTLARIGLALNEEKTCVVDAADHPFVRWRTSDPRL